MKNRFQNYKSNLKTPFLEKATFNNQCETLLRGLHH